MSDIRTQARELNSKAVDLISQVMEKHTKAILEEMRDQIKSYKAKNAKASKEIEDYIQKGLKDRDTRDKKIYLLQQQVTTLTEANENLRADYNELIFAVANKWPNELRHQTALRYIIERESSNNPEGQED